MKKGTLISVRSNCNFHLDYDSGRLIPQAEIIILVTTPKYVVDKKKTGIIKEMEVQELRFNAELGGINELQGQLQLLVKNMNNFEQTAGAINSIIQSQNETK